MSETTSKPDKEEEEDSQDPAEAAGTEDDDDLDLDAALFGDEDEGAEEGAEAEPSADAQMEEDLAETSAERAKEQPDSSEPEDPGENAKQQLAERNKIVMDLMTPEQVDRYEAFRRSNLNQRNMKRVLQTITGHNISPNILLVMRGMAKVYVGELVETARLIAHELGDAGPLQPSHYAAAYQQLGQQNKVLRKAPFKKLRL